MKIIIKKLKLIEVNKEKFGEFTFSDSINIVSGNNKKGKSTFIKSLMYSLGFEVTQWATEFEKENFIFIVECNIDNKNFEIIRFKENWIINGEVFDSKKYRKFLRQCLKINTELFVKNTNIKHIPYPTDLFLFNYVDQDSSFDKLFQGNHNKWGMYKSKELYKLYKEYIGISNQEIEKLKEEKNILTEEKNKIKNEQNTIEAMLNSYNKENIELISLKTDEYKSEINYIEEKMNNFLSERNKLEVKKYKILNELKKLDFERIQLEEIYEELEENTGEMYCKFCHSSLNQSFMTRYKRELSKNSLILQYADIKNDIAKANENLKKNSEKIEKCEENLLEIQNLFNKTQNNLAFSEMITNSIKLGIKQKLLDNFNKKQELIEEKAKEINKLIYQIKTKEKETQERENLIKNYYEEKIKEVKKLFEGLVIPNLENNFMNFENKKTGADKNITSVIIYYIYFSILTEFSRIKFPIIWDTFIKEVLDNDNFKKMEILVNKKILGLKTQIICSNVSNSDKEINLSNLNEYNLININTRICNIEMGEKENQLIEKLFILLQNSNL
ncbi:hypothetical protein [uncultured Fusobacterium sp.]|uniref:hypothetical protein n=1 Tax=uncultured Fusobacterium sp. TaxID=159267 RepID=UPI0025F200C9|nr:hypothetical protein [uncultured Fusobacterium sp.]